MTYRIVLATVSLLLFSAVFSFAAPLTDAQLVRQLGSKEEVARFDALLELIHRPDLAAATAGLKDPTPLVRQGSLSVLTYRKALRLSELAVPLLKDPDPGVRRQAAIALGVARSAKLIDLLLPLLRDKDAAVRQAALEAMGETNDPRLIAPLIPLLADKNSDTASRAHSYFHRAGTQATAALLAALKTPDVKLRMAIYSAFACLKDPRAVPALTSAARKEAQSYWRDQAMEALAHIGGKGVASLSGLLAGANAQMRGRIANALAQSDDPAAVKPLSRLIKDKDESVREATLQAVLDWLFLYQPARATELLLVAVNDTDDMIRFRAIQFVFPNFGPRAVEAIYGRIHDSNPQVREMAVGMLYYLDDERSRAALLAAAKDKDPFVSARASSILAGIRDPKLADVLLTFIHEGKMSQEALKDLTIMRDPRAIPLLMGFLGPYNAQDMNNWHYDPGDDMGIWLAYFGEAAVGPLLERAQKPDTLAGSLAVLGRTGDPRALAPLRAALADADPAVRANAALGLGYLGDVRALPDLVTAAGDKEATVCWGVAVALASFPFPQAIDPLLRLLQDKDESVRAAAVDALRPFNDPRVSEAMLSVLEDKSYQVHEHVRRGGAWANDPRVVALMQKQAAAEGETARVPAGFRDPSAFPALITRLGAKDYNTSIGARDALLAQLRPEDLPLLLERLQTEPHWRVKIGLVRVLGAAGAGATETLTAFARDPYPDLREAAAWSLALIKDPRAIQLLSELTRDEDKRVREAAINSLNEIRDPAVVAALLPLLDSPDYYTRQFAAYGLGQQGDLRAVDPLLALLARKDGNQTNIARTLGNLRDPRAVTALLDLLQNRDYQRDAIIALGQIGDPRAVPALLKLPRNSDDTAINALAQIDDPRARDAVFAALQQKVRRGSFSSEEGERYPIIDAMGHWRERRALPLLRQALHEMNPPVVAAAARALGQIGDPSVADDLFAILGSGVQAESTRDAATNALYLLATDAAVHARLLAALKSDNWRLRQGAARALKATDPAAVQALADDPQPQVREAGK